jgi:hypothetical protein
MLNGYPLDMMVRALEPALQQQVRMTILQKARRNPPLRSAWFQAKRELAEADESYLHHHYQHLMEDPSGRLLLDDVLDKEIGLDCTDSVHGWLDEFNPNDDLPF